MVARAFLEFVKDGKDIGVVGICFSLYQVGNIHVFNSRAHGKCRRKVLCGIGHEVAVQFFQILIDKHTRRIFPNRVSQFVFFDQAEHSVHVPLFRCGNIGEDPGAPFVIHCFIHIAGKFFFFPHEQQGFRFFI